MLTPVTLGGQGLGPMGRAPFSFFAPEPSFASGSEPSAAISELRELIGRLHEAGLEVILQVNITPRIFPKIDHRKVYQLSVSSESSQILS